MALRLVGGDEKNVSAKADEATRRIATGGSALSVMVAQIIIESHGGILHTLHGAHGPFFEIDLPCAVPVAR